MTHLETVEDGRIVNGVRTERAFAERVRARWAKLGISERPQDTPLQAHINTGRWVTSCPCGGGVPTHPQWSGALCMDCGRSWAVVEHPDADALAAMDAVLSLRPVGREAVPRPFYSWMPGETVEDLVRENARHGWATP